MASEDHCHYCFHVLESHFQKSSPSPPPFENDSYPLFVTWNTLHDAGNTTRLRGCIGNFSPQPLHTGLKEYALISAFKDGRFSPIQSHELSRLSVSVSLLTHFEKANGWDDWNVGTHGIRIQFSFNGKTYSGTYLPEVAPEQGWSKSETIESLVRKAGYNRSISDDLLDEISLARYQSSKAHSNYEDYKVKYA